MSKHHVHSRVSVGLLGLLLILGLPFLLGAHAAEPIPGTVPELAGPATAVDDEYATLVNTELNLPTAVIFDNDLDVGDGTAVLTQDVTHGTLQLHADGAIDYIPDADYIGTDTFKYKISNSAGLSNEATVRLIVRPLLISLSFNPASVSGGTDLQGTVTMSSPAPPGGTVVYFSDNSDTTTTPATVVIPQGQSSTAVIIETLAVNSNETAQIYGDLDNDISPDLTAHVNILAAQLDILTFTPASVISGLTTVARATMTGPVGAPESISIIYPAGGGVSGPASMELNTGDSFGEATLTAPAVLVTTTVTIEVNRGGDIRSAELTIKPPLLSALALSPSSVVGGNNSSGTVSMTGVIPTGGITVALSDNSSSITTPTSVGVASGQSSASFTIGTIAVTSSSTRQVSATYDGITKTANLTLLPPPLATVSALTVSPSTVIGGQDTTATVTASHVVTANTAVAISDNSSVLITPTSVTIPAGSNSKSFTVGTQYVTATATRQITATLNSTTRTANITLTPFPNNGAFTIHPTSVYEGQNVTGIVRRFGPNAMRAAITYDVAPYGGTSLFILPPTVTIPADFTSTTFVIGTRDVGNVAASRGVSVIYPGLATQTAFVTVMPITPASLSLSSASVTGGQSVTATASLNAPAGVNGTTVQILTSTGLTMPSSVTVAAGQSSATFNVGTAAVAVSTTRTVTVRRNNVTRSATLTVTP